LDDLDDRSNCMFDQFKLNNCCNGNYIYMQINHTKQRSTQNHGH